MSVTRVHGWEALPRSHGADKAARGLHSENMMGRKQKVWCPAGYVASYSFPPASRRPLWCCSLGVVVDNGARSAGEAVGDRRRQRQMTQFSERHARKQLRRKGCHVKIARAEWNSCRYSNSMRKAICDSSGRCRRAESVGALATWGATPARSRRADHVPQFLGLNITFRSRMDLHTPLLIRAGREHECMLRTANVSVAASGYGRDDKDDIQAVHCESDVKDMPWMTTRSNLHATGYALQ
jgi:hypothetical protein